MAAVAAYRLRGETNATSYADPAGRQDVTVAPWSHTAPAAAGESTRTRVSPSPPSSTVTVGGRTLAVMATR